MSECKHEPKPIGAFAWKCKHCDETLEAVPCKLCDGTGELIADRNAWETCKACNGTGVEEWRLA